MLLGWIASFDGIQKVWKSSLEEVTVNRELKDAQSEIGPGSHEGGV